VVPTGVGEGVTFKAIDDYYLGKKVFHEPKAIENRSIKFWHLPRIGAYACAPFEDFEGNVQGVLGFDTLGLERPFSAEELVLIEGLAAKTSETLKRILADLSMAFHAQTKDLVAKGVVPEPFKPPEGGYGEGVDPLEGAKAAIEPPRAILAALPAEYLDYILSRYRLARGLKLVFKGVYALVCPEYAAEIVGEDVRWADIKLSIDAGALPWGTELLSKIAAFDPLNAPEAGWEYAQKMADGLTTPPEDGEALLPTLAPSALVGKVMGDWLLAIMQLRKVKAEAEAAAAAAAAAAAEAAAAAAAAAAEAPPE
jgi:hypothetical protein